MSEFNKMTIISECAERQICCNQDIAAVLTIDEEEGMIKEPGDQPIDIIAVFDTHGHDFFVSIIREENLYEHFAKINPAESLQQAIDIKIPKKKEECNSAPYISGTSYRKYMRNKITDFDIRSSGSTLSFAKIYRNIITKKVKIDVEWLGDSPIFVFINDNLVFQSEIHNACNDSETNFLLEKGMIKKVQLSKNGFCVLSEDTIEKCPAKYIVFNSGETLAVTRSLGHNRATCIELQKHTIECSTDDEVRVVIVSDGVSDVINLNIDLEKIKTYSAEEIVDLAEKRWKQQWNYQSTKIRFPTYGYDDCSCAIWCQTSLKY
jgi:serine/threonine protein phosphatase PrpC